MSRPPRIIYQPSVNSLSGRPFDGLGQSVTDVNALPQATSSPQQVTQSSRVDNTIMHLQKESYDDPDTGLSHIILEVPGVHPKDITIKYMPLRNVIAVIGRRGRWHLLRVIPPAAKINASSPGRTTVQYARVHKYLSNFHYGVFRSFVQVPSGTNICRVRARLEKGLLMMSWPTDPSRDAENEPKTPVAGTQGRPKVQAAMSDEGGGGDKDISSFADLGRARDDASSAADAELNADKDTVTPEPETEVDDPTAAQPRAQPQALRAQSPVRGSGQPQAVSPPLAQPTAYTLPAESLLRTFALDTVQAADICSAEYDCAQLARRQAAAEVNRATSAVNEATERMVHAVDSFAVARGLESQAMTLLSVALHRSGARGQPALGDEGARTATEPARRTVMTTAEEALLAAQYKPVAGDQPDAVQNVLLEIAQEGVAVSMPIAEV
ncbi:hypothetical protein FISHEDRAFT_72444 [Fistulina hepatica ATCC 64428]|uniref:SHSP domain-containing protein n=1 Tax=Fistulina hepatica ATCC 64428 TaxID=1128425 RepID=A0A0D7AFA8_9AGAR|nr:hypothetical protein FISHEDRAFT_72444 [Fistulina hepatica ATCC 64428]